MTEPQNREAWLIRAAEAMGPWLLEVDDVKLVPMRVSVGWPGGRAKRNTVGQCWPTSAAEDKVAQIFMSPVRGDDQTVDVLGTLLHEMIHAVDDCKSGHQKNFIRIARAVGFIPKWTSSDNRSEELQARLLLLAADLGPFPHSVLSAGGRAADQPKKQESRQLKVACPEDGYTARTTRKWLDDMGAPFCPCGTQMEEPS